jgi:hypothetical protein
VRTDQAQPAREQPRTANWILLLSMIRTTEVPAGESCSQVGFSCTNLLRCMARNWLLVMLPTTPDQCFGPRVHVCTTEEPADMRVLPQSVTVVERQTHFLLSLYCAPCTVLQCALSHMGLVIRSPFTWSMLSLR